MRRVFVIVLGTVLTLALFAVSVHFVLVAAHVSEAAPTTLRGLTARRLWASIAAVLGLVGAVGGGLALAGRASHFGARLGKRGTLVALIAGPIASINGGLNLAVANGGPGTGNGVVGAAAAFVLGMIAIVLAGLSIVRRRNPSIEPEQMT